MTMPRTKYLTSVLLLGSAIAGCGTTANTHPTSAALSKAAASEPAEAAPFHIEDMVRTAQLQRTGGDLDGAAKTLGQLVLVAPDDPRVLGEYGKTLVGKGQPRDALAFLNRAIELQPSDWMLYSARGVAYDQQGTYELAQASFAQALVLKPGEASVLNNSALSHLQAGDIAGAEALIAQAAAGGSTDPKIASNLKLVQGLKHSGAVNTPILAAQASAIVTPPVPPPVTVAQPVSVMAAPVLVSQPIAPVAPVKIAEQAAPKKSAAVAIAHKPETETSSAAIFVQAGAYGSADNAGHVAQSLSRLGARVSPQITNGHAIFRVRIGPFHNTDEAHAAMAALQASGQKGSQIVRD